MSRQAEKSKKKDPNKKKKTKNRSDEDVRVNVNALDLFSVDADYIDDLYARLEAEKVRLEVMKINHEMEYLDGSESKGRKVRFYSTVGGASTYMAIDKIERYMAIDPGCPILVEINSPGGAVFDGLALIDKITEAKNAGHYVTTRAVGMAASMGGLILQLGDHRQMTEFAYMMIHEPSSLAVGSFSELQDEVALVERLQKKLFKILARHSNLKPKELREQVVRKDWWLDAEEALSYGFADEIV